MRFLALLLVSCQLVHGAIIDGESRVTPETFFAANPTVAPEFFASSGRLVCGADGKVGTAQVVVRGDLLLTSAHFFFDNITHHALAHLNLCYFEPRLGPWAGQRFPLRPNSLRIYGGPAKTSVDALQFDFMNDQSKDLAVIRFRPGKSIFSVYTMTSVTSQTHLLLFSGSDGGTQSLLQWCSVRDADANLLYTDCDVQSYGPSGAALLSLEGSVVGILSGRRGADGPYCKDQNSTTFVPITNAVRAWIRSIAQSY